MKTGLTNLGYKVKWMNSLIHINIIYL
jgi:hypothetical protein